MLQLGYKEHPNISADFLEFHSRTVVMLFCFSYYRLLVAVVGGYMANRWGSKLPLIERLMRSVLFLEILSIESSYVQLSSCSFNLLCIVRYIPFNCFSHSRLLLIFCAFLFANVNRLVGSGKLSASNSLQYVLFSCLSTWATLTTICMQSVSVSCHLTARPWQYTKYKMALITILQLGLGFVHG